MVRRWWSSLERRTRTRLVVVTGVALAVVAAAAVYVATLVRSLETPEVKQALLDRASAAVGARVQARTFDVKVLQGVVLEGVSIANPPPFTGPLVTADRLVLRYNPWSLLRGRVELTRLSADAPVLDLTMDARGVFNYEKLSRSRPAPATASAAAVPVRLVVSKLALDHGRLVVRDPRSALVEIEGADLDSSVRLEAGSLEGEGKVRIAQVNLADAFFVRDVSSPLRASGGTLTLAPLRATLATGQVSGEATVRSQKDLRFAVRVALEGAELRTLLEEARAVQRMSGTVTADAVVEGTGGIETLTGKGQVRVEDCEVAHAPLMQLVATVLRVPELAHPDFDECRATFTLGAGRFTNPSLSLKGRSLQLTGRGVTSLRSLAIDYDMNLALGEALARRIPTQELRDAFKDRGDGFVTIDFEVTGTTSAPQSDLALRVGRAAAESGLKKFLRRKLFN